MKLIKDEKGFTLIELMVTINLSFMALAFIISFFLMINKIFIGTTKRAEEKHATYDFFYKLGEMLDKSEQYFIQTNDSTSQIISSGGTLNFSAGEITGNKFMYVDEIEKYEVKVFFISGNSLILANGKAENLMTTGETNMYASDSIKSISLMLVKNRIYNSTIYNKQIPYKRFKNL
ncbi:MAG: type II secretion system protein [Ignavibacteriales bacterium]|nr:type II secretion system protein [Ignavibacteriales bacterium]